MRRCGKGGRTLGKSHAGVFGDFLRAGIQLQLPSGCVPLVLKSNRSRPRRPSVV
jgi:hypothetical protein